MSNGKVINEQLFGNDLEKSGRGLILGTMKTSVRIAGHSGSPDHETGALPTRPLRSATNVTDANENCIQYPVSCIIVMCHAPFKTWPEFDSFFV
jgi:hypothetical protein